MVIAADTGVFDRIKTFPDYQRADQEFQLRRALAQQQLQTGDIDAQAKKLSLLGQIVGNNSIDQASYDRARTVAANQGLDVSALPDEFNPDVVNRLRFAGATPTAQLTALIASQDHALKTRIATGGVGNYGYGTGGGIGTTAPAPQSNAQAPQNKGTMSQADQNAAMNYLYRDNSQPAQPVVLSTDQPQSTNNSPAVIAPPVKRPDETIESYNSRFAVWKADPTVLAEQEKAKKLGESQEKASTGNIASNEAYQRLMQNLDSLETLNKKIPSAVGASPDTKAWLDKRTGGYIGSGAKDLPTWNAINQQQALNALQDLVKSGGGNLRSNMLIDRMIGRGFIVDSDQSPEGRQQEIDTLRRELKNIDISSNNINARMNGGQTQDYQPTVSPDNQIPPGATLYGTSGGKKVYKLPNGTFLMEQ